MHICWSDIWADFKGMLPLMGVILIILCYAALIVFLLRAPCFRKTWQRITARVLGAILLSPAIVLLPALFFAVLININEPSPQIRIVRSSDSQAAKLSYQAGFLGRDYTSIVIQDPKTCCKTNVFWHAGPAWLSGTELSWPSNKHLRIVYHTRPDDPRYCRSSDKDLVIDCIALPLEQ